MSTLKKEPCATQRKRGYREHNSSDVKTQEEEPTKRMRRAARTRSRSKLAPASSSRRKPLIPLVQSDIGGVPCLKPRRVRMTGNTMVESEGDGLACHSVSKRSPTSPIGSIEVQEHDGPETQETRMAKLEQERNHFHDSLKKEQATSMRLKGDLLILKARVTPGEAEVYKGQGYSPGKVRNGYSTLIDSSQQDPPETDLQYGTPEFDQNGQTGQPSKVKTHQMVQFTVTRKETLESPSRNSFQHQRQQIHGKGSLLDARIIELEKDLEDARAKAQRAESDLEEQTTREYEAIDALQKSNWDLKEKLENADREVDDAKKIARVHGEQIKVLKHKAHKLEAESAKQDNEIAQLKAKAPVENDLANLLSEATKTLMRSDEDRAREREVFDEQVTSLKADLARLDKVEDEKRQLEHEKRQLETEKADAFARDDLRNQAFEEYIAHERKALIKRVASLKEDLARLDRVEHEKRQLETEKGDRDERIATLETEKAQQDEHICTLETEKAQRDEKLTILGTEKGQLETEKAQADEKIAALGTERAQRDEKIAVLETEKGQLETKKAKRDKKIAILEIEKAKRDEKIAILETEKAQQDEKISTLDTEKAQRDEKIAALETGLSDETNKHEGLLMQLHDARAKAESTMKQMDTMAQARDNTLEKEKTKHAKMVELLEAKAEGFRVAYDKSASVVRRRVAEVKRLEAKVDDSNAALEAKEKEMAVQHEQSQAFQAEIANDREHQQRVEQLIVCVKSQICRKIEDERLRELDHESATERAAMEGLQEKLVLKFDYIEDELEWYKQKLEEKNERVEVLERCLQVYRAAMCSPR